MFNECTLIGELMQAVEMGTSASGTTIARTRIKTTEYRPGAKPCYFGIGHLHEFALNAPCRGSHSIPLVEQANKNKTE
jgi:hypothetical protein